MRKADLINKIAEKKMLGHAESAHNHPDFPNQYTANRGKAVWLMWFCQLALHPVWRQQGIALKGKQFWLLDCV